MAHSPSFHDDSGATSRLRKLCAAKDAQIEGLTSRVEVLSDDMHDLRRERDYLLSTCTQLEDCAHQCQEEAVGLEERVAALEVDLETATHRAEAAEAAPSEANFAATAAAYAPPTGSACGACMGALAEAQEVDGLSRQNAVLRAEVDGLRAEVDGLRDQLIERTESELASLAPRGRTPQPQGPRPSGGESRGGGGGGGGSRVGTPAAAAGSSLPWEEDVAAATLDMRARWQQELRKADQRGLRGLQWLQNQPGSQPSARQPACRTPRAALPTRAESTGGRPSLPGVPPGSAAPSRAGSGRGGTAGSAAPPPSKPPAPLSASQSDAHRLPRRPLAPGAFPAQVQAARGAGGARAEPPPEPKGRRRPPAAHEEIRALLAAKQSALLAVADW